MGQDNGAGQWAGQWAGHGCGVGKWWCRGVKTLV